MFTGIIEELGRIRYITTNEIQIECKDVLNDVKHGDSIAVNGVCLTVTNFDQNSFLADISPATMKVTNFEKFKSGDYVNLERAMRADGRFGGHIVSGHIDCTCRCERINKAGEFYNIDFKLSNESNKYLIKKGSIAINGISLTVADITDNTVTVAVIPHTYENTNLKSLKAGDFVNIEFDILAKYIEKFLSSGDNRSGIDNDFLTKCGFN